MMTSSSSPHLLSSALPRGLLDRVEFGLRMRIHMEGPGRLDAFCDAMRRQGLLVARNQGSRLIKLGLSEEPDAEDAGLNVVLAVGSERRGAFFFTSASSIRLNTLVMLRRELGDEVCGPPGLDGRFNTIGAAPDDPRGLLGQQLRLLTAAVGRLEAALRAACEDVASEAWAELWVRGAELALDLEVTDPRALVRSLSRTAVAGAATVATDAYRVGSRSGPESEAVRWWRAKIGPVLKAYAKRADLLRVEVGCARRPDVRRLLAREGGEFTAAAAASFLLAFARAAEADLDGLVDHVRRARDGTRSPAELLIALAPLVGMAAGRGSRRGRPPGPGSVDAAREALDVLFNFGLCRACGFGLEHGVRRVLDELSAEGGPLVRERRDAVYALRPEFAASAAAVALAA